MAHDVVIIGAGAAGLMAAITAAREGADVRVVETRPQPGAKIRVSGGGRCNVLPSEMEIEDFYTAGSLKSVRNILGSWPLEDVREFFEDDLGLRLKVEDTGKVFPVSDSSREVVTVLLRALRETGSGLTAPFRVTNIERHDEKFHITSADGESLQAARVVLSTGGLSMPKSGSDGGGMSIARALGHSIVPTFPALVPLLSNDQRWHELSGVSVPARITAQHKNEIIDVHAGSLLFTHFGFSGPVILNISHALTRPGNEHVELRVRWGDPPGDSWETLIANAGSASVRSLVSKHLPTRLASLLITIAGASPDGRVAELPRDTRTRLVETLDRYLLPVHGNQGYRTAEVTGGGVPLSEVKLSTLESRMIPGLHLCGEILDTTGKLGGYNFLWAWVTGRKAGISAAKQ
jgi:predicted Rossmann fold flavoprotein